MIKKNKSKTLAPAPQPGQLDSIERLLAQERYNEASAKAERLSAEFPEHIRLRDLRIQALASTGQRVPATLLALDWSEARPNSRRAWALLFALASDYGMGFLAFQAHARLEALGMPDGVRADQANESIELMRTKYVNLTGDEGLRSDRGLLYMMAQRLEDARTELESTTHPVPQTNLAAVLFDLGDMPGAIRTAQAVWEERYGSYAARTLVRALLYTGELQRARAAGEKLKTMQAREPDELAAQLEALNLLEDFAGTIACFNKFDKTKYETFRPEVVARVMHAAAVAFLQTGERAQAQALWERASAHNAQYRLYQINLMNTRKVDTEEPAWLEMMGETFPYARAKVLQKDVEDAGGAAGILQEPDLFETEMDAHSIYLGRVLRVADPLMRAIARTELVRRLERGDEHASHALQRFTTHPFGTDGERIEAVRALYYSHKIERSAPVAIHLRKQPRTLSVNVPICEIDRGFEDLPKDALNDYVRAVFAAEAKELRDLLGKMEKWLGQAVQRADQLKLEHRVILILHAMHNAQSDAAKRLQWVIDAGDALPRTYAFAARVALSENDLPKAAKLLEGQLERAGTNDEDLAPMLLATRELHAARKEEDQELATWIAYEALGAFEPDKV